MKIPLTKYGLPQVAFFPALTVGIMIGYLVIAYMAFPEHLTAWPGSLTAIWVPQALMLAVLVWLLSFFRDPHREVPQDENSLLAPADGTITGIDILDSHEYFDCKVMRVSIFLSVFNVHVNRMPCAVRVEDIIYKQGAFRDARHPDAARVNEANDVIMTRLSEPTDRVVVRQVSGAVARRIVCEADKGEQFAQGQRFGMIKFGSRTELIVPFRQNARFAVRIADKVRGGLDTLVRYE